MAELSELDTLMKKLDDDPLGLTKLDLEHIVAIQRQARANAERGIKAVKTYGDKIDLKALGLVKPKAPIKRRV